jgi:hypothetical protein
MGGCRQDHQGIFVQEHHALVWRFHRRKELAGTVEQIAQTLCAVAHLRSLAQKEVDHRALPSSPPNELDDLAGLTEEGDFHGNLALGNAVLGGKRGKNHAGFLMCWRRDRCGLAARVNLVA